MKKTLILLFFVLSLAGCDSQEEKQTRYIERGNALFAQGDLKKARLAYLNAARINPADAGARYHLGLVDEAEGNLQRALSRFLIAEQQDSHYTPALEKLAQYFLAGKRYELALTRIQALLETNPKDAQAHALYAAFYLGMKNMVEAEKKARDALALEPSNVTAFTVLAGLYAEQQQLDKAVETIEQAIKLNPDNVALLRLKALIYERQENVDKIAEAYQIIFQLKPAEVRFRDDLANAYVQAGRRAEAEAVLRQGIEAMPTSWAMKQKLVAFLAANHGLEAAEKEIKAYIKDDPDQGAPYFWLAELYSKHDATDRVIVLLEEIIKGGLHIEDQSFAQHAQTALARLQFIKGNKLVAKQLAEQVLQKDPNNRDALFVRAQALYETGDLQDAIVLLRTILRDDPQIHPARQLLAEAVLAQGFLDLAVDTLTELALLAPTNVTAKVRLAQLLSARGETDRALVLLDDVIAVNPQHAVAWESKVRFNIGAKRWSAAQKALETLETLENQSLVALFLQAQMAQGQGEKEKARALYQKVMATDPLAPTAHYALTAMVDLYVEAKDYQGLIVYLTALPARTPLVLTYLGEAFRQTEDFEKAAEAFEQSIAEGVQVPLPYLSRARLYLAKGQSEKALDLLKKAQDAMPANLRIALMRAELLIAARRYDEVKKLYNSFLARNPDNVVILNNLAQFLADTSAPDSPDLERARLLAERFIRSTDPNQIDTLAWIYFKQERYPQALALYERLMANDQNLSAEIYYHYGVLLYQINRFGEAKSALEKAMQKQERFAGQKEAQVLLNRLQGAPPTP
ncbi:MAG: tetratricopeptide repeat protein [Alphaproteobacteria bacterium]|nr:tetratricopeptide repeat protein [Alphaproteobacteria bacterium]